MSPPYHISRRSSGRSIPLLMLTLLLLLHSSCAQAVAKPCGLGKFLKDGKCEQCPPGTYQSDNSKSAETCSQCPPGTYNPYPGAQGFDRCSECPAGTFNDKPGATSPNACGKCPSGTHSQPGSPACRQCPPGTFIDLCPLGYFASGTYYPANGFCVFCGGSDHYFCGASGLIDKVECTTCYPRTFSGANALRCESCPPGTYSPGGSSECLSNCPAGSAPTFRSCDMCRSFTVNDGTMGSCQRCPPGFIGDKETGGTRCVPCPKGTFRSSEFDRRCSNCAPGENSSVTGASFCIPDNTPCPPNFFKSGTGACRQCSRTERFDIRTKKCVSCPRNQISEGGLATKCIRCPRQALVSTADGDVHCVCKPGWGFEEGTGGTVCRKCRPGTASSGTGFCSKCSPNEFAQRAGMESCMRCPEGKVQPTPGQRFCVAPGPCPVGLVRSDDGKECIQPDTGCPPYSERINSFTQTDPDCYPTSCPMGTTRLISYEKDGYCGTCMKGQRYNEAEEYCESCKSGETSDGGTSTVCEECPGNERFMPQRFVGAGECRCGGFRQIVKGECQTCPRGMFGFEERDGCEPCPAGTFSNNLEVKRCENCPAGSFTDVVGATECQTCPSGTVSFGVGETGCVRIGSA